MDTKEKNPWDYPKPATKLPWHCVDWQDEFKTTVHDEYNSHVCEVTDTRDAAYLVEAANRHVSMCMAIEKYDARVRRFAMLIAKYNELYGIPAGFDNVVEEAVEIAKEDSNG